MISNCIKIALEQESLRVSKHKLIAVTKGLLNYIKTARHPKENQKARNSPRKKKLKIGVFHKRESSSRISMQKLKCSKLWQTSTVIEENVMP
jgi:hypothetical protein